MNKTIIATSLLLAISVNLVYATEDNDLANSYKAGYHIGYQDGLENPVDEDIRDNPKGYYDQTFVDGYLDGFRDGCQSIEGNTYDFCEDELD